MADSAKFAFARAGRTSYQLPEQGFWLSPGAAAVDVWGCDLGV